MNLASTDDLCVSGGTITKMLGTHAHKKGSVGEVWNGRANLDTEALFS
jgi:hypothetical protein